MGIGLAFGLWSNHLKANPKYEHCSVSRNLCFMCSFSTHLGPSGVSVLASNHHSVHYITLFPLRQTHPVWWLYRCLFLSPLCFLSIVVVVTMSTSTHITAVFSPAFSFFHCILFVLPCAPCYSKLALLPLTPRCFIGPFSLLCMKWVYLTTLYVCVV